MKTFISYFRLCSLAVCAILVAGWLVVSTPSLVKAGCADSQQEVSLPVDQGGTKCVPINERTTDLAENPIFFYLRNIIIFLAGGVGLAVVGGIVWGAYLYITARANASQAQQGQNVIINAVIGLILFIFMWAILQFLIPGGVFR